MAIGIEIMEFWSSYYPLVSFTLLLLSAALLLRHKILPSNRRRPPGPLGWPIFGNMFQLGTMPHRTLAHLRDKYGPVIWLRIGAIDTMVILSAKTATQFFKNHDQTFAERSITDVMRVRGYDKASLALAPYGSYWRVLRRLVTVDMIASKRVNDTAIVRRRCVDEMLVWIKKEAEKLEQGHGIEVARFVFLMSFNLLGNLILSRNLFSPESKEASEFFTTMMSFLQWSGHPNVVDLFPWLRWLDPQGLRSKMERDMGKALDVVSKFVKDRLEEQKVEGHDQKSKDFLDVLLEFQRNGNEDSSRMSDNDLNIFVLELFIAASETSSSTIEWALTELLCNPEVMVKVKDEVGRVIGPNRKLEESDIDNLPYLQAVIKETFRLHPPIPFLVPRKAMQETIFMGYNIPKDTQVFVNAWAIGRDPDVWEEPLSFKPERFIGSEIDYKGQHYELIPFGAGRRMCAGVPLAHRALHLILGSLLHHFDWELDGNVSRETMDMKDSLGVTMRKREPLLAVPKIALVEVS
ncbi:Cytochrome P450 family protein [Quillaja saponaria]|uniref:Cytochrome P450 family protein n=1 Tax=Quillaja saponaria TaxID=32244 RepID=A0AAD7VD12_QUISA|nr:Cytochrome P450 family protein [Quillaja saponaria]